ncbi:unnamed protein product [Strongylus vulgaris]|uniref:Uncharacterized protein n=1 Tax=Strongylus vulgaris TaxID=40348 RepID=A0A3P7LCI4_STRVU|nr:unnamed protein product [Strongylus vulgaris]
MQKDRLRTKALDQKCKVLEEENEKLMEKVCEFEMRERDEADMTETCKQLEKRIREAEEREQVYRAECELRLETARLEVERKSEEAAQLLEQLHDAKLETTRRSLSIERNNEGSSESNHPSGQTETNAEVEQLRAHAAELDSEMVHLREEIQQMSVLREELEQLRAKCSETADELDRMHCTNFELMTKSDNLAASLKAKEEENQTLRAMYDRASEELQQRAEGETREEEVSIAPLIPNQKLVIGLVGPKKGYIKPFGEQVRNHVDWDNTELQLRAMYDRASEELSQQRAEGETREEEVSIAPLIPNQKLGSKTQEEMASIRLELNGTQEQKASLEKELDKLKADLASAEASLASYRVDLGKSHEKVERLESDLFAARSELDNARLGLKETTAVKKELEQLREELEHEKSSGRAKWEEVCKKFLESEASSPQSRKNSLEVINKVQHIEYMTAFEEKIKCLEKELQEAKAKIEQDKAEKKKLKLALKQLRDKEKSKAESAHILPTVSEVQETVITQESTQNSAEKTDPANEDMEKLRSSVKVVDSPN